MCGILFVDQSKENTIDIVNFEKALDIQKWRGKDAQHTLVLNDSKFLLGHNRLSIIDPAPRSDQPMVSQDGRYAIVYNGEVYNHLDLRRQLGINCRTTSDTETVLEGYAKIGEKIFELLDGMFALVILEVRTGVWVAARDPFGIKPLFIGQSLDKVTVLGSEAAVVARLLRAPPCQLAVAEWRLIRRPLPGESFFQGVKEIHPGTIRRQDGSVKTFWMLTPSSDTFRQEEFEELLKESIVKHEISDVENVSMLSGGLDSAVITALSSVRRCYSVGLTGNHEFEGATDTAVALGRELLKVSITPERLIETWRELTRLRGEPIGVPNEALIYNLCRSMTSSEKVVLTGEGADEILFGYDGIYRWAISSPWVNVNEFLIRYGYSNSTKPTERLVGYIEEIREGKSNIEFMEDFFYLVHLPGLLRRMDFASMAASKEARVPFVSKRLISYMYRRASYIKINESESKLPLRAMIKKLRLPSALNCKKIGFSAQINKESKFNEYAKFQNIVLEALDDNWIHDGCF